MCISGDDYLNIVSENTYDDDTLDIAVSNMLFDSILLLKRGINVVLDFVFCRESEAILLEKMLKTFNFTYALLDYDARTVLERDSLRSIEDRMGERCSQVIEDIHKSLEYFSNFPSFMHIHDASLNVKEIAQIIIQKISE